MARFSNFAMSGMRGKIGNVVFSNWKGIDTAKMHQGIVSNPKTDAQVSNRSRFKLMSIIASLILPALRLTAKEVAKQQSEYNWFVSNNIASINVDGTAFAPPAFSQVPVGKGSCPFPEVNFSGFSTTGLTFGYDPILPSDFAAKKYVIVVIGFNSNGVDACYSISPILDGVTIPVMNWNKVIDSGSWNFLAAGYCFGKNQSIAQTELVEGMPI
jgi:hypothetical protein